MLRKSKTCPRRLYFLVTATVPGPARSPRTIPSDLARMSYMFSLPYYTHSGFILFVPVRLHETSNCFPPMAMYFQYVCISLQLFQITKTNTKVPQVHRHMLREFIVFFFKRIIRVRLFRKAYFFLMFRLVFFY